MLIAAAASTVAVGCGRGTAKSTPVRIPLADIPVGSGKVFRKARLVIMQPKRGDIRVFSAICPHQGCTVALNDDDVIECPCHGAEFSATDGSVLRGPAREALPARAVTIQEAEIIIQ